MVAKSSATGSGSIVADQNIVFSGTTKGANILQDAKISLSIMQKTDVNMSMQTDIINNILAEVSKSKSDFPQISASKSDTEITNIVKNNVSSSLSMFSILLKNKTIVSNEMY